MSPTQEPIVTSRVDRLATGDPACRNLLAGWTNQFVLPEYPRLPICHGSEMAGREVARRHLAQFRDFDHATFLRKLATRAKSAPGRKL